MENVTVEPLELASAELIEDPYPSYASLRDTAAVCRSQVWDCWYVSTFQLCQQAVADVEAFDPMGHHQLRLLQQSISAGADSWQQTPLPPIPPNVQTQRGEGRRTTGRATTIPFLDSVWPTFEEACRRKARALRARDGAADLVHDYISPLVTTFLAELMAIDEADRPVFAAWCEQTLDSSATSDEDGPTPQQVWKLFADRALDRMARPVEDFVGSLTMNPGTHRTDGSGRSAHLEFVASTCLMISRVTHQGMAWSMSTLLRALVTHPESYALLRAHPLLCAQAVEEGLRYDTTTQAIGRLARHPVELGGAHIGTGDLVVLLAGSAHRDPAQWERPDEFDITRPLRVSSRHLGFGYGAAACVGAGLARKVLIPMLRNLVAAVPELCAGPGEAWVPEFMSRGLTRLPVAL